MNDPRNGGERWSFPLAIDVLPVTDFDHADDEFVVFNRVEDSIVPLAQSVALLAGEFLGLRGAGIVGQILDRGNDPFDILLGEGLA